LTLGKRVVESTETTRHGETTYNEGESLSLKETSISRKQIVNFKRDSVMRKKSEHQGEKQFAWGRFFFEKI